MFPEVARPVAGITSWGEPVTLRGFRRYRVQLDGSRGHFPAIVPDDAAQVHGLLFRNITEKQLQRLDEFEEVADGSYVRAVGSIETVNTSTSRGSKARSSTSPANRFCRD